MIFFFLAVFGNAEKLASEAREQKAQTAPFPTHFHSCQTPLRLRLEKARSSAAQPHSER